MPMNRLPVPSLGSRTHALVRRFPDISATRSAAGAHAPPRRRWGAPARARAACAPGPAHRHGRPHLRGLGLHRRRARRPDRLLGRCAAPPRVARRVAVAERRHRRLDDRRPALDRVAQPHGRAALPVARGRLLPVRVPGALHRDRAAPAPADRLDATQRLADGPDGGPLRRRARGRARLPARRRRQHGLAGRRRRGQPRLPARRPGPARLRDGVLRRLGLAPESRLASDRCCARGRRARRRHLHVPVVGGQLRRGVADRLHVAGDHAAAGARRLAVARATRRPLEGLGAHRPSRLLLPAHLRPPALRRAALADAGGDRPVRSGARRGDRARRAHQLRAPRDDAPRPRSGAHGRAERAVEPPPPDRGPRGGVPRRRRGAHARLLRPRRLQALQRPVRARGRRATSCWSASRAGSSAPSAAMAAPTVWAATSSACC